jgi:hypothetical protein
MLQSSPLRAPAVENFPFALPPGLFFFFLFEIRRLFALQGWDIFGLGFRLFLYTVVQRCPDKIASYSMHWYWYIIVSILDIHV